MEIKSAEFVTSMAEYGKFPGKGLPQIAVAGKSNVGKSTLINRLYGGNVTKTEDRPGVTRSNRWVRVGTYLEILDTPGMLWPRLDDQAAARRLCYTCSP